MKKKNLSKLSIKKSTISELRSDTINGAGPPRSVPYTNCQITYYLSCICDRYTRQIECYLDL